MARYRKIDPRMWGDEKFCRLTPIQPSGQALWLYLLTGPHNNVVPGLFSAGEVGLAERLRWSVEAFRKAFREGLREELFEYDGKALVISIPNAINYDFPANPNVVKSWVVGVDEIPECELKNKHMRGLREALRTRKGFSKAFIKAFDKAFPKGFSKGLPKTTTTTTTTETPIDTDITTTNLKEKGKTSNQNRDRSIAAKPSTLEAPKPPQSQKQDKETPPAQKSRLVVDQFEVFWKAYPKKIGKGGARRLWVKLKMTPNLLEDILTAIEKQKKSDQWRKDRGQFIPHPTTWLNQERWTDSVEVEIKNKPEDEDFIS